MIKQVELTHLHYTCFKDFSPFTLTENDVLILEFESKSYDLTHAVVTLKNGKDKGSYSLIGGKYLKIEKDNALLKVGRLDVTVSLPNGKQWYLDGIKIKMPDDITILELSSWRDDIEARLSKLEQDKSNIFNI